MKSDCNIFSRVYLACQERDGDVNKFVCHGNHPCPISLSVGGKLRLGSNADALPYVEVETATSEDTPRPVDAQFLDGAAVVQMLNPGTAKTFLDIAVHVFCHICTWKTLLDWTVFGMYFKQIEKKMGKGVRRPVVLSALILENWKDFLYVWTRTIPDCLAYCNIRSPDYKEMTNSV